MQQMTILSIGAVAVPALFLMVGLTNEPKVEVATDCLYGESRAPERSISEARLLTSLDDVAKENVLAQLRDASVEITIVGYEDDPAECWDNGPRARIMLDIAYDLGVLPSGLWVIIELYEGSPPHWGWVEDVDVFITSGGAVDGHFDHPAPFYLHGSDGGVRQITARILVLDNNGVVADIHSNTEITDDKVLICYT